MARVAQWFSARLKLWGRRFESRQNLNKVNLDENLTQLLLVVKLQLITVSEEQLAIERRVHPPLGP